MKKSAKFCLMAGIAALFIILAGGMVALLTAKDDKLGICRDKVFSRPELDQFIPGCTEKQLLASCGNNIGMVNQTDGKTMTSYYYRYPRAKLTAEFRQKYGTGFGVDFVNDRPVDWDVTGLPGTIAAMTQEQLDAKLKVGMTAAEVKAIFGEPNRISRGSRQMNFTYFYPIVAKGPELVPLSAVITLEADKTVSWWVLTGSPEFEALSRRAIE